jgi:hypothetical protein
MGKTDIEDALTRLDLLTQEARLAAVEALKVTHTTRAPVEEVADVGARVDDKVTIPGVTAVEHRVMGVDDKLMAVYDKVMAVYDKLMAVDGKVTAVNLVGESKAAVGIHGV